MPLTSGFFDPKERERRFISHGSDFGALDAAEYEQIADAFLGEPKPPHVAECVRKLGDVLRFDPATDTFGVLDASGLIRTFFKPVPCSSVVPESKRSALREAGRCHRHPNNLLYFKSVCARW